MAALIDIVKKGATDRSVSIRIIDATDGTPETGVVFNTSGIDLWYRREGGLKVSITEADLATPALDDAHADGGFLHIGDGEYRLDLPDAAFASGANHVDVGGTVTGMVVIGGRVRLVNYDPEDAVRLGLTALPNAAADAAGGLPISDAGSLDLDARLDAAVSSRMPTSHIDATAGKVDGVALVDVTTTNSDMRGTDGANTTTPPTAAAIADAVADEALAGHTTAGSLGKAIADTEADAAAILLDTAEIGAAGAGLTEAGGTGDHLTTVPWNVAWDAEVQSEATDALNAYDPPTKAELDSGLAALNDLDAAGIRTAVGLATANLDTQLAKADLTAALTEAYRATGATGSAAQMLYEIIAHLGNSSISGTTKSLEKLDKTTVAKTFTLDDATTPTAIEETT